jgi:hypothetical protein
LCTWGTLSPNCSSDSIAHCISLMPDIIISSLLTFYHEEEIETPTNCMVP